MDNMAEYLTNIDKFLIIFYGKWQIQQKTLKITQEILIQLYIYQIKNIARIFNKYTKFSIYLQ